MNLIFTYSSYLFSLEIQEFSVSLCTFVPIMFYSNTDTSKLDILSKKYSNPAIYMWVHIESGKKYIGSTANFSKRMNYYYSIGHLVRSRTSHIHNALLFHGYGAFSLTIFEFIDISHLPKEKARKLILEREQLYIDSLGPEYNINPIAGSRLGSKSSTETIIKLKEASRGENNPMFGRTHSSATLAKMSEAHKGKIFSEETRKLLRKARANQVITEETKAKISKTLGKKVFVFSSSTPTIIFHEFGSYSEAAKHFNCSYKAISYNINTGNLFKKEWLLFSENKQLK